MGVQNTLWMFSGVNRAVQHLLLLWTLGTLLLGKQKDYMTYVSSQQVWICVFLNTILQLILVGLWHRAQPLFSSATHSHFVCWLLCRQVQNISTTHTFSIDKARRQLGYSPEKFAFADSVEHYIKTRAEARSEHVFPKVMLLFLAILSLIFLSLRFDDLSVLHFFKETQH